MTFQYWKQMTLGQYHLSHPKAQMNKKLAFGLMKLKTSKKRERHLMKL